MQIKQLSNRIAEISEKLARWQDDPSRSEVYMHFTAQVAKAYFMAGSGLPAVHANSPSGVRIENPNTIKAQPILGPEGEAIELSGVVIDILDYFTYMGWSLEEVVHINLSHIEHRMKKEGVL